MSFVDKSEQVFFDQLIADRGEFNAFSEKGWDRLRLEVESMLAPNRQLRILDIGCGTGSSRQLFKNIDCEYIGLDLSLEAIRFASLRHPEAKWIVGSADAVPFASATFDVVAFSSVLHHLPSIPDAIAESHRVLKSNGYVFGFDPNLLNPAMLLLRYPKSPFYIREGVSPNESPITAWAIRKSLSAAGFEDVRVKGVSIEFRSVEPKLINFLLPAYRSIDRLVELAGINGIIGTFLISTGRKVA